MKAVFAPAKAKGLRSPTALLGAFLVLVLWAFALYPLTPSTLLGWFAMLLCGVAIFLWLWGCVEALLWLERPRPYSPVFKALGYPVALSLGIGVFAGVFFGREFLAHNFSYFFR